MAKLGRKFTCYSCHTKFYDLGKPVPTCPKCGADQRDAEDAPVVTAGRGKRIVEEPVVEEDFPAEPETEEAEIEDEELVDTVEPEEEDTDDEEEEF